MKKLFLFLILLLIVIVFIRIHIALFYQPITEETESPIVTATSTPTEITYLDIGQGDATFIQFASGEQVLVDCAIDSRILEALGRVMPIYDNSIDYLIITHPDKDHYGGCIDVLDRFDVGHIVYTGFEKDQQFFQSFMQKVQEEQSMYTIIDKQQVWNIAEGRFTFLYPDHSLVENSHIPGLEDKNIDANNTSIIFLLDIYDTSLFFSGDAETALENYIVKKYGETVDVDIYKAGHHGSSTSSVEPLVQLLTPSTTVFSAGKDNSYGHPSQRIINRVERAGSSIWRTDINGDILVTIYNSGYHVTPQYSSP